MLKEIIPSVHLIKLGGLESNIYLINRELLVDTGTGHHKKELKKILNSLKLDFNSIKKIINTHCHFDHIGGNNLFPDALKGIHKIDAETVEKKDLLKTCALLFGKSVRNYRFDIKLDNNETILNKKLKLKVIHTPGHTEGSACLYDEENKILFSGDTVFYETTGRTDLFGGSYSELKDSLEKLSKLDIKMILPGHGRIVPKNGTNHIKRILRKL